MRKNSKRNLLALVSGLTVIILIALLKMYASAFMANSFFNTYIPSEVSVVYSRPPYSIYNKALGILALLSPVLAGLVVGLQVKGKPWVYGAALGFAVSFTYILCTTVIYLTQHF